jgi:hypothetical protein
LAWGHAVEAKSAARNAIVRPNRASFVASSGHFRMKRMDLGFVGHKEPNVEVARVANVFAFGGGHQIEDETVAIFQDSNDVPLDLANCKAKVAGKELCGSVNVGDHQIGVIELHRLSLGLMENG